MRLVPVTSGPDFWFRCGKCGEHKLCAPTGKRKDTGTPTSPAYADLDGPSFAAYVCAGCYVNA